METNTPNITTPSGQSPSARGGASNAPDAAIAKRGYAPGQDKKRRGGNPSEYKKSLVEKQTLKRWYGLSEKQFKRYVKETLERMDKVDDVSAELIRRLETRLDNVIFRLGFAKSRPQARQLVSHGYFKVNGKSVNIPSYKIENDDVIVIKENKKAKGIFKELAAELKKKEIPVWLSLNKNTLEGKSVGKPSLEEVKPPAEISLIFEFYSR